MASIRKPKKSKFYHACFRLPDGTQSNTSTKLTDPKLAQQVADTLEATAKKAKEGKFFAKQMKKVLNDFLELGGQEKIESDTVENYFRDWLKRQDDEGTFERYEVVVNLFLTFLGKKAKSELNEINYKDILRYMETRKGFAPKTKKLEIKVLGGAFDLARKNNFTDHNPVEKALAMNPTIIKGGSMKKGVFTLEQVKALLEVATGEWKTIILLGFNSGARLSDCAQMKWSHINFTDRMIDYISEKKDVQAYVPMIPELEKHLNEIAGDTGEQYISPELATWDTSGKSGMSESFKKIMIAANIDPGIVQGKGKRKFSTLSFHSFRHTCNSLLANAGVDQELRMKIIAHKSVEINTGYTHMEHKTLRSAMDKMPSLS